MKPFLYSLIIVFLIAFTACQKQVVYEPGADAQGHTAPTSFTTQKNAKVAEELPLDNQQDFEDARRGLIASDKDLKVRGEDGSLIWNMPAYNFIHGKAPASVNPSLWRQAKLNDINGLFEVTKGVYQLRGFDLADMSIIVGKTGWIVVDPLTSEEDSAKALAFARAHLPAKPIVAIIFSHSHIDHFGGALGVMSAAEAKKNGVHIYAPKGFIKEATSENVMAGTAMSRRAMYMYGTELARSVRGHVGSGLGKAPSLGSHGILIPTDIIDHTPEPKVIDGVKFIFQYVPGSEAPTEMTFYLPDLKTFCGAEIVSHNMHNLYTLRGAKIRDALRWSNYIDQAIHLFGDAEVYFGCHHWPIWGNQRIMNFLKKQRDLYKYLHDQTLRLANEGLTPNEIAATIKLPDSLRMPFYNRGYYGTVNLNVKAIYQFYFGWYDGNPAHLNPLPPVEASKHYIEYMGGAESVLKKARASFAKGEYRWVAEVLNHLVFADPGNVQAKELLAKTYDQLGYQSESGPCRDEYLTAADELRHGKPKKYVKLSSALDLLRQTPVSRLFDAMAARVNGPKAAGKNLTVNIIFTDIHQSYVLSLENAVLHHRRSAPDPKADATVKLTHELYLKMAVGQVGIIDLLTSKDISYEGSKIDLIRFFSVFDHPKADWNIVTP